MNNTLITQEWEGYTVVFNDDAFTSITSLCRPFGKRPNDFLALPFTKRFIEALAKIEKQLPDNLVITSTGRPSKVEGFKQQEGTWVHPDIALECARWLSPSFAIWCNRTIRGILNGEIHTQKEELPAPVNVDGPLEEVGPEGWQSITEYHIGYQVPYYRYLLARRVKKMALAMGVVPMRVHDAEFGMVYAWPDRLYSMAEASLRLEQQKLKAPHKSKRRRR